MKVLHAEFNYVYGSLPVSDMNQIQTSAKPTPVQTDCFTFLCPLDLFYWKMYEPFTPSGMEYYFCSILQSVCTLYAMKAVILISLCLFFNLLKAL